MVNLSDSLKYIVPNLTECVISLFNYNWSGPHSFNAWLSYSSDSDFEYIYIMEFKRHLIIYFNENTEKILSLFARHLSYSIISFFKIETDYYKIIVFIKEFIHNQLNNVDYDDLF